MQAAAVETPVPPAVPELYRKDRRPAAALPGSQYPSKNYGCKMLDSQSMQRLKWLPDGESSLLSPSATSFFRDGRGKFALQAFRGANFLQLHAGVSIFQD